MTGMWQSVIAKNNKGWKAIQLTRKAGILKLLLRCEEMLPEKMEEERIKQAEMQERMEARRSKNLSVIKRTKGDGGGGGLTGSTGAAAEQERLALEEDEAAVAAVGRKKKGKRRKKKAQEGVEFSQEWGSASAF